MTSVSPIFARFALQHLLNLHVDEERLFRNTGLSRLQLESSGDIEVKAFVAFLTNGWLLSNDDALGLAIARRINAHTLGPVTGAVIAAPTVREGLKILENFLRLHVSYIKVELHSGPSSLSVRIIFLEEMGDRVERYHAECSVCQLQDYVEMITGDALVNAEYHFRFREPEYAHRYPEIFHSRIYYGSDVCSVELPPGILDEKSPYYDVAAWDLTRKQLAEQLRIQSTEQELAYSEHVTAFLNSHEPPLPVLSAAADQLHLSERSLNRRLQEEGTSFRSLKQAVLRGWAQQFLTDKSISVESIGAALGYKDAANFRRAFRHWEGCSPNEYRRRLQPSSNK